MTRWPALAVAAALSLSPLGAAAQRFTATVTEDGHPYRAGVVRLDPAGRLSVVSAPRGRAAWLKRLVDDVNAQDVLQLDAVPPPGAPRFADATSPVPRSDPRFTEALRQFLDRYYDVTLR